MRVRCRRFFSRIVTVVSLILNFFFTLRSYNVLRDRSVARFSSVSKPTVRRLRSYSTEPTRADPHSHVEATVADPTECPIDMVMAGSTLGGA